MSTRILGIGSPMGPDRLGWQAADALAAAGLERRWPGLEFRKLDRPGSLLLAELQDLEQALLIDALDHPGPAGALLRLELDDLARAASPLSAHRLGVAEALALGRALGGLPSRLVLFGIALGTGPWPEPSRLPSATRRELLTAVTAELAAAGRTVITPV